MRSIKSAERTLALFELFTKRQRPLSVGRIAAELNIPQPSTSMLLSNLLQLGYISYDRFARTYTPTIRVALLGGWINHRFDQAGGLTARLKDLQRRVDETVFIGIQNGAHAQYIFNLPRDKPNGMQVVNGHVKLLTGSAVGRALLSLKSDQEILKLTHRCNAEAGEARLRVVPSDFLAIVTTVRERGYAQTRGDITPDFGAFAVTVDAPHELVPIAVGVGLPIDRIEQKRDVVIEALAELKGVFAEYIAPEAGESQDSDTAA
ncbi:hypothetical protein AWL63_23790 (plasmid) [Sphingomonas panacis]|uniref:IclR family transcriptional regulator n=1 Tax=Sphingomonas panacis TaxID=1560345 RepID=A0A1B3ZID1_9SPHN|nr:helix-turn-helix domain-containing protein [Sphingomonas panacis]AOH87189.1 hypothetical protein AWL63_23790 [Sphingomonas panacis]